MSHDDEEFKVLQNGKEKLLQIVTKKLQKMETENTKLRIEKNEALQYKEYELQAKCGAVENIMDVIGRRRNIKRTVEYGDNKCKAKI